jgi:uncharacterized membrane protein
VAIQERNQEVSWEKGEQTGSALPLRTSGRHESDERRRDRSGGSRPAWMARGLGWLSLGLGLGAVAAPRQLARVIGVGDDEGSRAVLRAAGLRQIATGVGILAQSDSPEWHSARIRGDMMDLALLGSVLTSDRANRPKVAAATAATAAVVGIMAMDLHCREQFRHQSGAPQKRLPRDRSIRVQKSGTVNRSPEDLYRFWHNFENLPRFMNHLQSVQVTGEKSSHWKAKGPARMTVEWDAEIIADSPNELIAWRSLDGADVDHVGSVRFERAPGGRGTEVRVEMQYIPPGGVISATLAKLLGEAPDQQTQEDLRRFKQLMEAGEIVQSGATARDRGPAQPPAAPARS